MGALGQSSNAAGKKTKNTLFSLRKKPLRHEKNLFLAETNPEHKKIFFCLNKLSFLFKNQDYVLNEKKKICKFEKRKLKVDICSILKNKKQKK